MVKLVFTAALLATLAVTAHAQYSHKGMGTAYSSPYDMDATGQNMCEYNPRSLDDRWQRYYAAMNEADWNAAGGLKGICGRCIAVRGVPGETTPGHVIRTIYAKIVDQCPDWACDKGNVDFSTLALEAITGYGWDKKKITWDYVDCPTSEDDKAAAAKAAAAKAAAAKAAAAKAEAARAKIESATKAEQEAVSKQMAADRAVDAANKVLVERKAEEATAVALARKLSAAAAAIPAGNEKLSMRKQIAEKDAAVAEQAAERARSLRVAAEDDLQAKEEVADRAASVRQKAGQAKKAAQAMMTKSLK